jgi:hypothetical protein
LPRPTEPRKSRKISSQTWLWIVVILFSLLTFLAQCGFFGGDKDSGTGFDWFSPHGLSQIRLVWLDSVSRFAGLVCAFPALGRFLLLLL